MNKAVFLDRDGTINVDSGYLADPEGLIFIHQSQKAIKLLKDNDFLVFVVTNQSGVGRGYFTLEMLKLVNEKLVSELGKDGIKIDGIFYCPHTPEEKCSCRKPSPKLLFDIAGRFNIDLHNSYFVGDKLLDVQTGNKAGCQTVLIDINGSELAKNENGDTNPDLVVSDLYRASQWIIDNYKQKRRVSLS